MTNKLRRGPIKAYKTIEQIHVECGIKLSQYYTKEVELNTMIIIHFVFLHHTFLIYYMVSIHYPLLIRGRVGGAPA